MPFTQITSTNIKANTVAGYAEFANFAASLAPRVSYANVANSLYFTVDDTAVNVGGGYIVVTGANFQSGATVLIDTVQASAVTYVDSTTLRVQVPARSAATYSLYVVNPDGGTGIRVNALTYSSEPSWTTASPLANQAANTAFGVNLSATSATSYSLAAGSTLPAGTTLAANGYFSGTVSIGAETTYSFSIVATDAELQDSSKTFQVTVTVTPATRLYIWGRNSFYNLGLNDLIARSSPTQVGSDTNWSDFDSSIYSSLAIKTDGTLWGWGQNGSTSSGILGLSPLVVYQSSPVQIGTNTNWSKLSVGQFNALAIKTDGTLWSWGYNHDGYQGHNDTVRRSSPTQVGSGTTWLKLATGLYFHAAIKTDGTLWTWGRNGQGQLGLNDRVYRSSPVQIGSNTNWSDVIGGQRHFIALKTDGTLWGIGGDGFSGSLGLSLTSAYRSSPVQIGSSNTWSKIAGRGNNFNTLAIKTDGTLWTWGVNQTGQLGTNDVSYRSSPTQLGTGTDWNKISVTNEVSAAIKTNGTLWLWGRGNYGMLGQNNTVSRSSPTQVGTGTNWSNIYTGGQHTAAITTN